MSKVTFIKAIISARILQLYYHYCHQLTHGKSFFADHEFLGGSYEDLTGQYDRLVENYIGVFGRSKFETKAVNTVVCETLNEHKVEEMCCCEMLEVAQELEAEFYKDLESLNKAASLGLQNVIGDLAESAEVRKYKIQQRLLEVEKEDED